MLSSRRVLMIVGGVGLGNATRQHALIEKLKKEGVEVDVASSGRGLEYFAHQKTGIDRLIALPAVTYGASNGALNIWNLPSVAVKWLTAGVRSFFRLRRAFHERQYKAVVVDSNYNLAPKVFFDGPVISVNNADRVVAHRRFLNDASIATKLHFYLVELLDHVFQRLFANLVISPWPVREARPGWILGVGLITRERAPERTSENATGLGHSQVLLMGSGSGLGQLDAGEIAHMNVNNFSSNAKGPRYDTLEAWSRAQAAVINAGFSSLSEGLAHRRKLLVLPIGNHAEQHIVSGFLKSYGWVQTLSGRSLSEALDQVLQNENALINADLELNGADEATAAVMKAAGLSTQANAHLYRDPAKDHLAPQVRGRRSALDAR